MLLRLSTNVIAGAGIDVFEKEPYDGNLAEIERCILTAHMGSMSDDCRTKMEIEATEEVVRFLTGNELEREAPQEEYDVQSDGTENIWILDSNTFEEIDNFQVYTNKGKVNGLNELEWVNGKIYANRYGFNGVAIINPDNGAVDGVIDLSGLKEKVLKHNNLDVLNGIAYNKVSKTLFRLLQLEICLKKSFK